MYESIYKTIFTASFLPASASRLAWAASLLAGCTDRVDEWIPDGRTASVTLHVPMADIRSTHTTDEEYKAAEEKINTLRILVFSQDKPVINKQFKGSRPLRRQCHHRGCAGRYCGHLCRGQREAALGKDYSDMADFEDNLVQVGNTKKLW